MAICKFCNQENAPGAITCANCGANIETANGAIVNEKPSALLKVISFLFPLVGVILYFVKRNENRTAAKAYGKMALISFILGVIFSVVLTIVMVAATVGLVANKENSLDGTVTIEDEYDDYDVNFYEPDDNLDEQFSVILDGAGDEGISVKIDSVEPGAGETVEEHVVPTIE